MGFSHFFPFPLPVVLLDISSSLLYTTRIKVDQNNDIHHSHISRFRFLRMTEPSHKSRALERYLLNLIKDFSVLYILLWGPAGHAPVLLRGSL